MSTVLAAEFARTTSGYILGIGLPVISTVLAVVITRFFTQTSNMRDSLAEANKALALLVQQATTDRASISQVSADLRDLTTKHGTLAESVAVLKACVDEHLSWANRENDDLRHQIRDKAPTSTGTTT